MFSDCDNLVYGPEILPSVDVNNGNMYQQMFYNCKSLKESPILPATTVAAQAYNNMFRYCYNLQKVTCLMNPATAQNYWLYDVYGSGTFVRPAGVTYRRDVQGIPTGWTIEDYVES